MFKQSSSPNRAVGKALFLVAALLFQSFSAPTRGVVYAKAADAEKKATSAPANAEANLPGAIPQPAPVPQDRNAPQAAVIVATLTDNVTAATKIAPGANINYTATITNNGAVSPADDATSLNFSAPLDANTTLVGGSIHASPIAFNETYNWVGNTQLDTAARALPAVTANDVAVNAPAGTDTFTVTAIAGGATSLGGTVTLASPSGAFTYTPPVGRPNIADGASVNDTFTYTIANNADASLTSTGTVTITLTGRVWYLQAGAAGDGRSNTPSGSPANMSTAADKSTDFFYIFSNAGSLNGPFSVDAGQQLLGQGVNLVVSSITLFTAAAPTPTTTNTAGNCVALAGAPGNNTLSGFNIGNCTGGTAITGANVGTLNVSTMTINTNGGALDLTGVGTPTVSVVLGGTTSSGGAKNVNLVGLNGTFTLASGALSGATGNALDVNGGNAGLTFSGTIQNSGARQVNIINKTGGTVALSGAIGGTGTGIFLSANNGATLNFTGGIALSTAANDAFTATGPGPAATSGGTINVTQNNTSIVNTLTATTGSGLNIKDTTIGASGVTFRSITSNGAGSANGIIVNNTGTTAGLTITGNGGTCSSAATCTGGTISNKTGADGSTTQGSGIFLNSTSGVSIDRMQMNDFQNFGIKGSTVTGFSFTNSRIVGLNGTTEAGGGEEGPIRFDNLFTSGAFPTATITGSTIQGAFSANIRVTNAGGTLNRLVIDNCTLPSMNSSTAPGNGSSSILFDVGAAVTGGTLNFTISNSTISGARSHGLSFTAHGGAHMDAIVTQNKVQNADTHILSAASNLLLQGGDLGVADITYNISCNKFSTSAAGGGKGAGVILFKATNTTSGSMVGTFSGNAIGVVGQAFSGAPNSAPALWIQDHGAGTFTTLIQNNTIVEYGEEAIDLQRTSGSSTMNASVFGNTVTPHSPDGFCGLNIEQGAVSGDTGTMNLVVGNSAGGAQQNDFSNGDASNFSDIQVLRAGSSTTVLNLSRNSSASGTVAQVLKDDNINGAATAVFIPTAGSMNLVAGLPATPPAIGACALPPIPNPDDGNARNRTDEGLNSPTSTIALAKVEGEFVSSPAPQLAPVVASVVPASTSYRAVIGNAMHHAISTLSSAAHTVDSMITPTAYAQDAAPNAPTSGEVVSLNTIATFPAGGKSITIKYSATVNTPPLARQVSTQGTVTAAGGISVLTDDPEPVGPANPTVTLVDTLMTWNGATSTNWNTITNWTQPAGGTQYAPGVSNPAINDVVIPNVGAQPNIPVGGGDIGLFSMSIANGRTLTIDTGRTLTIGGSPGGDLTVDGIISGGFLNLGTGTHVINNAGGTGSLSATNVATVLSGSTVTLNNNLQMGALAVNPGGSMNITNRTLSLNGSGAALTIPGGATFTTTGSTVVYNGTAAQQAAGIAYNNLTINNTIGAHVTGVTLTGNASVAAVLTLTSSDLATTGAFTLTMPVAATSGPASGATDVVGNVKRTGFVSGGAALSFGNPFNTIKINSGAAPADINMLIAKNAPATYAAAVLRSYTITPNGANGPATLRLHYRNAELNGNVEAPSINFNLRKGPTWAIAVVPSARNTGVPEDNWLENNAVASFSEWTMATLAPTASGGVINGRITRADGTPVEGAVINLSGGQARKTITDADGNYHFSDVAANGFYTVTPSRANFSFNPFNRSFSMVGNQTEAAFNGTMLGDNLNPLDTPEYFVRQQYVDILGREPDEDGFNYWSNHILACGGDADCVRAERTGVASAFFIENEFRQSGAFIYNVYKGALGRRPVYAEYSADRRNVVGGATLEEQKQAFAEAFVTRAEFATRYEGFTNAASFVDALLANVQQTSGVDLSGQRDSLIESYNTGTSQAASRTLVLRGVTESAAVRDANYNSAFVVVEYFGYLHRGPDQQGLEFWLNVLNTGDPGNYRGMVCSFITSREYQNRFSVVVSHSNGECGQ